MSLEYQREFLKMKKNIKFYETAKKELLGCILHEVSHKGAKTTIINFINYFE